MQLNKLIIIWVTLSLVGFISTGCSFNIQKYGASIENVGSIKSLKNGINVGDFDSKEKGKTSISCRAEGNVVTPNNLPFEQYIKNALITELKLAEKYDENSKITITGYLEEIDFNSNIGTASWTLKIKLMSNNSKSIVVNSKYEFSGSYMADKACSEIAQAFNPAVQKLISDIIKHPDFNKLL